MRFIFIFALADLAAGQSVPIMPPTNLPVATAPARASVALKWSASASPEVVGYNIYYGTESGDYTNEISTVNVTNLLLYTLTPATYYFWVETVNSSGIESAMSGEATYTVTGMVDQIWLECDESTDMVHWCWRPVAQITNDAPQEFYGRLRVRQVAIKIP